MGRRTKPDTTWMLRFFFQEADGKVSGLRSWWAPLVEGRGRVGGAPTAGQLRWAGMESDIAARLELLSPMQRNVLALAYGHGLPLPSAEDEDDRSGKDGRRRTILSRRSAQQREDEERYGAHPAVALMAPSSGGSVAALRAPLEAKLRKTIRTEAEAMLREAKAAWDMVAPEPKRDLDGRAVGYQHDLRRRAAYGPATAVSEDGDRQSGEVLIDAFCPAWETEPTKAVG